ncbi:hypothetical protein AA16373_0789 [Komagataeibacter swingsii DSM 16373]|nr:hypothetical protein AA16373_0789 [Komagataeibacter swingsii DSM 16373]
MVEALSSLGPPETENPAFARRQGFLLSRMTAGNVGDHGDRESHRCIAPDTSFTRIVLDTQDTHKAWADKVSP